MNDQYRIMDYYVHHRDELLKDISTRLGDSNARFNHNEEYRIQLASEVIQAVALALNLNYDDVAIVLEDYE